MEGWFFSIKNVTSASRMTEPNYHLLPMCENLLAYTTLYVSYISEPLMLKASPTSLLVMYVATLYLHPWERCPLPSEQAPSISASYQGCRGEDPSTLRWHCRQSSKQCSIPVKGGLGLDQFPYCSRAAMETGSFPTLPVRLYSGGESAVHLLLHSLPPGSGESPGGPLRVHQ